MASLLGQRRLSPCQQDHHNLIVDVIDKEMSKPESRIHEKRHPAEDKTPGKVLALWGDESHDEDFYAPYFSSKPMNFDGEFSRMRHCLGVVSHRGHKPEQPNQDEFFVLVRKESVLMGILDGHGPHGHSVAHFAQEHLPGTILEGIREDPESWEKSVKNAVTMLCRECQLDSDMANKANVSGTTMTVLMLDSAKPLNWRIRSAHLGDSIAVLAYRKGGPWQIDQLTDIHRPDRQDEMKRIQDAGGSVVACEGESSRLLAGEWSLAMSRSWGDFHAASAGLSHDPEFNEHVLPTDCECFILVCSDGVWDVIPPIQAVNMIGKYPPEEAQSAVEKLVSKAQLRWQEKGEIVDDITALVLFPISDYDDGTCTNSDALLASQAVSKWKKDGGAPEAA
ncbi:unnamed protein product [Durusdinium trenchii]|uniref:PPM-type phosphatase domain-containing protein n=1 Tax=Durusdinium trenchii TaxID=1381693 RepID=A0ABP0REI2_9DINO